MKEQKTSSLTARQLEACDLLAGPQMHLMLDGGSRSGKSFVFAYALVARAMRTQSRHVILRKHFSDIRTSIGHETMPAVLGFLGLKGIPKLARSPDWFWTFPNGSEIWLGGLDDKERADKILGKEYSTLWYNECSQIAYSSVTTGLSRLAENSGLKLRAYYDCNPPGKKHWAYLLWFLGIDPESRAEVNRDQRARLQMNPDHNRENLPPGYIEDVLDTLPERQRRRFRKGEWADDIEGALWKSEQIAENRVHAVPDLVRVVVAVDPAVTSGPDSDETGIIVAGKCKDGHGYVLADSTLRGTPLEWAKAVHKAYKDHKAGRVVGEVNNGGDLVESNIRTVAPSISYRAVRASRGKAIRAEPVAALYEQGRMHHVGHLPELEDEMCSWIPGDSKWSPNRMDALVWAVTELGLTKPEVVFIF